MDESSDRQSRGVGKSISAIGLAFTLGGIYAWPYIRWFAHPSLFDDDFLRVGSLRRSTWAASLFRPFNEHMAPLFETISWLSWLASGRDLMRVPLAFQVSSYVALILTVGMLAAVAYRELRSTTATWVCVAFFVLSAVSAETILWFSASSFEWSAFAMLAAWYAVLRSIEEDTRRGRWGWLWISALASLAAPGFSAIGILAGPLAILRLLIQSGKRRWSLVMLFPGVGTVAYLLICQSFAYDEVVRSSLTHNLDLTSAFWATLEAPAAVLIPGLFGQSQVSRKIPGNLILLASLAGFCSILVTVIRSQLRPVLVMGLGLIIGGYLAVFATRARAGDLSIFEVQRYHLFPQIGLALLLGALSCRFLSRFDRRPTRQGWVLIALSIALAIAQYPRMDAASDRNFRYPDQPRVLAATLHLEAICDREGITNAQAMRTLDPIRAPWFPVRLSFNPLVHLFGTGPATSRLPDSQVRSALLDSLAIDDREAIFGGLNAGGYRLGDDEFIDRSDSIVGRIVGSHWMEKAGSHLYRAGGHGSWIEFEVGPEARTARALIIPILTIRDEVEIWWAGEDRSWTSLRSVRSSPDPQARDRAVAISLDRLPHWRPDFVRRIRLVFREWGEIQVSPPQFFR